MKSSVNPDNKPTLLTLDPSPSRARGKLHLDLAAGGAGAHLLGRGVLSGLDPGPQWTAIPVESCSSHLEQSASGLALIGASGPGYLLWPHPCVWL